MAKFLRTPRTQCERRANADSEYGDFVRAARRRLPSDWDDRYRSDIGDRSWKRARKQQWH